MAQDSTLQLHRSELKKSRSKQSSTSNQSKDDVHYIGTDVEEHQSESVNFQVTEEHSSQEGVPNKLTNEVTLSTTTRQEDLKCNCKQYYEALRQEITRTHAEDIDKLLSEREKELREEYDKRLEKRTEAMRDRYNFIVQNEQVRTSYMLREAHRERQEKISALQTQLQCKNLTALMYVMCTERNENKLEKLRIIEEYTRYIHELQDTLAEGQCLILNLSRGYKTAARVDHEWREKMKKIVSEFMAFILHFTGGTADTNQFFFDLQELLKTETSIVDNPDEDPCEKLDLEEIEEESTQEKEWFEQMGDSCRPFVVFGDMADFKPAQRREVLKSIKATKTAPPKWKEYLFKDIYLRKSCPNSKVIKDLCKKVTTSPRKLSCHMVQTEATISKQSFSNRRGTTHSIDMRGQMGSLLKIMTSTNMNHPAKTTLLGARDSMEITSATRMREKSWRCEDQKEKDISKRSTKNSLEKEIILNIGRRRTSLFEPDIDEEEDEPSTPPQCVSMVGEDDLYEYEANDPLGSVHHDSLSLVSPRTPGIDHKINYERVCPMEKCQRLQVDSFIRHLPPYMRASPFTHFDQNFEEYELCSPEQLEILRQRIEDRKTTNYAESSSHSLYTTDWQVDGVATQTSETLLDSLPPCTCPINTPSPEPSNFVFDVRDLIPVKQALDTIQKECFYDDRIEFNRFKVLGQTSSHHIKIVEPKEQFHHSRFQEIRKVLKQHPSLMDIFQANTC